MGVFEDPVDHAERLELTKRAQGLVGQLLWLSGRTRPDLAYVVSIAASKIVPNPREAVARAEHLARYLRHAPGAALHYISWLQAGVGGGISLGIVKRLPRSRSIRMRRSPRNSAGVSGRSSYFGAGL